MNMSDFGESLFGNLNFSSDDILHDVSDVMADVDDAIKTVSTL